MLPLRDINPSETRPIVTKSLIVLNVAIFFLTFFREDYPLIVDQWGFKPIYLFTGERLETLITSMFLHGDLHHLLGNMLFLWIFGDNVEDALGHLNYLAFYISSGIAAAITQSLVPGNPYIPMIGASGAISGVLGMYIIFFPFARIVTAVFYFFIMIYEIPAIHYIWFWFVIQFLYGMVSIFRPAGFGVAYWAHIGGFVFGVVLGLLLKNIGRVRLRTERYRELIVYRGYRWRGY